MALAGLGVGFVVGLTGMGGGALMTPILVLLFKVPPLQAVSSDLVASMVMKPIGGGVHLKKGTVNLRLVGWLVIGSVPAAFVSVWALQQFADPAKVNDIVQWTVGVALLLASLGLAVKGAFSGRRGGADNAMATVTLHPVRTVAIGVFGGVMVGLTSVGSGSLMMVLAARALPRAELPSNWSAPTSCRRSRSSVPPRSAHMLFGEVQFDITGALADRRRPRRVPRRARLVARRRSRHPPDPRHGADRVGPEDAARADRGRSAPSPSCWPRWPHS